MDVYYVGSSKCSSAALMLQVRKQTSLEQLTQLLLGVNYIHVTELFLLFPLFCKPLPFYYISLKLLLVILVPLLII